MPGRKKPVRKRGGEVVDLPNIHVNIPMRVALQITAKWSESIILNNTLHQTRLVTEGLRLVNTSLQTITIHSSRCPNALIV
jgi:hypothetical protein